MFGVCKCIGWFSFASLGIFVFEQCADVFSCSWLSVFESGDAEHKAFASAFCLFQFLCAQGDGRNVFCFERHAVDFFQSFGAEIPILENFFDLFEGDTSIALLPSSRAVRDLGSWFKHKYSGFFMYTSENSIGATLTVFHAISGVENDTVGLHSWTYPKFVTGSIWPHFKSLFDFWL